MVFENRREALRILCAINLKSNILINFGFLFYRG